MSKKKKSGRPKPDRKKASAPGMAPTASDLQVREIEDPDFTADHEIDFAGNRKTARVTINVRESAIETLYARRFLGTAQKAAADRFRSLWEAAGGKTVGIDYSSDRVDGGKGDPAVARLQAAQELKRCRLLLGIRGYDAVEKVCAEGRALSELTPHKRERLTMADNLRADLDDLASMWGFQTRRRH
ncbi:MAG: hypothetical protein EPN45_09655 [Rhizobiaceae bacterium]|nr:MAG: hypothetical protein EPN45_09655 [Rhizobiaceae bacterium]